MGQKHPRQLNGLQRSQLYEWMREHKEAASRKTSDELAVDATADLGFTVGPSSTGSVRLNLFPEMRNRKRPDVEPFDARELIRRVGNVEHRVDQMEQYAALLCRIGKPTASEVTE